MSIYQIEIMENVSKQDLIKLAKKLRKKNQQLQTELDEINSRPSSIPAPLPPQLVFQESTNNSNTADKTLQNELKQCKNIISQLTLEKSKLLQSLNERDQCSSSYESLAQELADTRQALTDTENLLAASQSNCSLKDEKIKRLMEMNSKKIMETPKSVASPGSGMRDAVPSKPSRQIISKTKQENNQLRAYIEQIKLERDDLIRSHSEMKDLLKTCIEAKNALSEENILQECEREKDRIEYTSRIRKLNAKIVLLHRRLNDIDGGRRSDDRSHEESEETKLNQDYQKDIEILENEHYNHIEDIMDKVRNSLPSAKHHHHNRRLSNASIHTMSSVNTDQVDDYHDVVNELECCHIELNALKDEIEQLERSRSRVHENMDYLHNIIFKYLEYDELITSYQSSSINSNVKLQQIHQRKQTLVPVIATILHFSPQECKLLNKKI